MIKTNLKIFYYFIYILLLLFYILLFTEIIIKKCMMKIWKMKSHGMERCKMMWGNFPPLHSWFYEMIIFRGIYVIGEKKCKMYL
jgi:hypothetical protein